MKKYKSFIYLFLIFCGGLFVPGCIEDSTVNDHNPLDILTGKEDVEAAYYKQKLKNPAEIKGTVSDYKTQITIPGALLTAKESGSNVVYTAKSKDDGTYILYVEGNKNYIFSAIKDGYEKSYYFQTNSDQIDTILSVSSYVTIDFDMIVNDSIPLKEVEYISTRYLTNYIDDLSFTSDGLAGLYDNNFYQFDINGNITKTSVLKSYSDMIAIQDTFYWMGSLSSRTLTKYGQKGGKLIQSVYCQVPSGTYYDFEILNNSIWMISSTKLYNLSLNGELLKTYDFSNKILDMTFVGLTKSGNFLYILNKADDYYYVHKGYCLYKFDTTLSSLVQKGYLPSNMNTLTLSKLSFSNNTFWSIIGNGYNYNDLIKFEIVN